MPSDTASAMLVSDNISPAAWARSARAGSSSITPKKFGDWAHDSSSLRKAILLRAAIRLP